MKTTLTSFVLLLSLTSCIKTAEQINREKQFSSMSTQLSDSQGLVGKLINQSQEMQSQIDNINGKLEEVEHKQSQINTDRLNENHQDIILLKTQLESAQNQIKTLTEELKIQKEYSQKITDGLKEISKEQAKAPKAAPVKTTKEKMHEALGFVSANKYITAKNILETLIDHKDLTAADHNKVLHGLGRVELYTNNPDKALVYLSKIVMNYPRSSLAPNSLYLIGKSFQKQKKDEEAKQAFNKLITDYPQSADASKAKKEL